MVKDSSEVTKYFGERLKELRTEKGLSAKQLGKLIGCSDVAIIYWENNKRSINPTTIYKIAKYFGVSSDFLLGLED